MEKFRLRLAQSDLISHYWREKMRDRQKVDYQPTAATEYIAIAGVKFSH